ncbi:MAG: hypothetical protein RIS76_3538, partial [Verrucomicrobiota bacterium]
MKTVAGTRSTPSFELESRTVVPPAGARAESLTSPSVVDPPRTGEWMSRVRIFPRPDTPATFATRRRWALSGVGA